MLPRPFPVALLLSLALLTPAGAQQSPSDDGGGGGDAVLAPTDHPRLPNNLRRLWLAPDRPSRATAATRTFTTAVAQVDDDGYTKAIPVLSKPAVQEAAPGQYGAYYLGLAQLGLGQADQARRTFQTIEAARPTGFLAEAAPLGEAEADEALDDQAAALTIYERLAGIRNTQPDAVLMRLARAARATGDTNRAANTFARVYYEFPLSQFADAAGDELRTLPNVEAIAPGTKRYQLELGRAERLFGAKQYAAARAGFEAVRDAARGDDRELVGLRLAECDYFQRRTRQARSALKPYIDDASRQAEALFFYALATRDLGDQDGYYSAIRRLVAGFPTQSWAEEALNNLATRYIIDDDDWDADQTFRELYQKFPSGRYAERAAWKIGWWAYKDGRCAEAARVFEEAAARFPRSNYRPSWLYWAGRSHDALQQSALAVARYTLVATDYLNSYYGRLAAKRLAEHGARLPVRRLVVNVDAGSAGDGAAAAPPVAAPPPNEPIVRALLGLELYDQAIDELGYAQKIWGDSPMIQATLGWIYNQQGDLRAGINAMKRAYPQYMAAGGEQLPTELLKVLFPVDYWPLIRRYATAHHLDPYLIVALIAQESTFTVDIRSAANAYGLMQLLPSTGRRYARKLHLRYSRRMLTRAEPNIRMGTAYFADLVQQFGGDHLALASYNAGENRVAAWVAERPGVGREEFIDDIPFPETQNYVKRILGTAEDYRRLYGPDASTNAALDPEPAVGDGQPPPTPARASSPKPAPALNRKSNRKKSAPARRKTTAAGRTSRPSA